MLSKFGIVIFSTSALVELSITVIVPLSMIGIVVFSIAGLVELSILEIVVLSSTEVF